MFGFYGMFGGEEYGPWGSATISRRAEGKLEDAKRIFDQHIAACDTSNGPVGPVEIISFHLVAEAQKKFREYVKQWGVKPIFRFDNVPKRKSKACFTSVTITPEQQAAFLAAHPGACERALAAATAAAAAAPKAGRKKVVKENQPPAAAAGAGSSGVPPAKRMRA